MNEYKFRFIKSSWGIAIDVVGNHAITKNPLDSQGHFKISERIWLDLRSENLTQDEKHWIYRGLETVAESILSKVNISDHVLITIFKVNFNPCDYQPDGLYCAVAGWASVEFNFPCPRINIEFDKKQNSYLVNHILNS